MAVQTSNPSDTPEPSPEVRPLNHDEFFVGTFQRKRLAKAFLKIMLPGELLGRLDLDGLTAEPRHITDELFKTLIADVVYRVPIKETDNHIDFFIILEHKSYNDFWTIFQLWGYVLHVIRQEFKMADDAKQVNAEYRLPPVVAIILHHGESRFTGKTNEGDQPSTHTRYCTPDFWKTKVWGVNLPLPFPDKTDVADVLKYAGVQRTLSKIANRNLERRNAGRRPKRIQHLKIKTKIEQQQ